MPTDDGSLVRDYGGWRRRRGIGLWGLGPAGTFAVLAAVGVVVLAAAVSPALVLYVAPPVLVATGLGVARVGGESLGGRVTRRVRWQVATARGWAKYRQTTGHERCLSRKEAKEQASDVSETGLALASPGQCARTR